MDRLEFITSNELHLIQYIGDMPLDRVDVMLEAFCQEVRHYYFLKENG